MFILLRPRKDQTTGERGKTNKHQITLFCYLSNIKVLFRQKRITHREHIGTNYTISLHDIEKHQPKFQFFFYRVFHPIFDKLFKGFLKPCRKRYIRLMSFRLPKSFCICKRFTFLLVRASTILPWVFLLFLQVISISNFLSQTKFHRLFHTCLNWKLCQNFCNFQPNQCCSLYKFLLMNF